MLRFLRMCWIVAAGYLRGFGRQNKTLSVEDVRDRYNELIRQKMDDVRQFATALTMIQEPIARKLSEIDRLDGRIREAQELMDGIVDFVRSRLDEIGEIASSQDRQILDARREGAATLERIARLNARKEAVQEALDLAEESKAEFWPHLNRIRDAISALKREENLAIARILQAKMMLLTLEELHARHDSPERVDPLALTDEEESTLEALLEINEVLVKYNLSCSDADPENARLLRIHKLRKIKKAQADQDQNHDTVRPARERTALTQATT